MPEGLSEIQQKQRQLAICENGLVQQAIVYRSWENQLLSMYKSYLSSQRVKSVSAMDKMEGKLLDAYEDIVGLLNERQTLQTQIEDMHEAFRMRVLDVCDSLPNAQPTPRLNREWVDATRERLMEWMHEKGEMECRVRMWDLSSFQRQLRKSALAGFARHDADAEANKKYVSQYVINLIGYAVRVGRFTEEIVRSMYEHERNEIEFNLKLADNFKNMEKERMDQECTMFTCAMAGQNISKWTEEHARRSEYWTFEREKMYYEIHHARKQVLRLREAAELELNALYGERAEFMDKQIKDLEEVALRAKRLRELMHARTILTLQKIDFGHRSKQN